MTAYSREEALAETGATAADLDDLEGRGLLVPNRPGFLSRALGGQEYYTESQLGVLRWLLKTRRAVEASRR